MRKQAHFLETLFCILALIFFLGRIAFFIYNRHIEDFGLGDVLHACRRGFLAHDFSVSAMLLALPWMLSLLSICYPRLPLRALLTPYYIIMGFVVGTIIVADTIMYEFWQFKLNAVVLSYAAHPEGATSSVSFWFIASRVLAVLGTMLCVTVPSIWLTPKHIVLDGTQRYMRMSGIIWGFLIVSSLSFTHVGDAFRRGKSLFLDHAAVNPVLAFFSSFPTEKHYADRYNYLDEADRDSTFRGLYPQGMDDISDTLLNTQRPNVLVVFLESFGGTFVKELGGLEHVAPQLSRLIPEGVFWENYYSNSFRTDRGTASLLAGCVSYPEVSLMTRKEMHAQLPNLAKTFNAQGYFTSYLYGGPMTNMGKRTYLENSKFGRLLDYTVFTPEELTSTWGADDEISARKVYSVIAQKDSTEKPFFMVYQTISSHEPWVVPYHRLPEEVPNAFAYTDACVGQLIDSLKTLPVWDNLLVMILPDHGHLYHQSYEDPLFFHSPMLWLGGALRQPRRMAQFMNQSDIAATLFAQMGVSHDDYPWSRNVLSEKYVYPFVYCNYPGGIFWADSTGYSLYDVTADEPIIGYDEAGMQRIHKAKAVLQTSYDQLDSLVMQP